MDWLISTNHKGEAEWSFLREVLKSLPSFPFSEWGVELDPTNFRDISGSIQGSLHLQSAIPDHWDFWVLTSFLMTFEPFSCSVLEVSTFTVFSLCF